MRAQSQWVKDANHEDEDDQNKKVEREQWKACRTLPRPASVGGERRVTRAWSCRLRSYLWNDRRRAMAVMV
jgi:hypothetical protein